MIQQQGTTDTTTVLCHGKYDSYVTSNRKRWCYAFIACSHGASVIVPADTSQNTLGRAQRFQALGNTASYTVYEEAACSARG